MLTWATTIQGGSRPQQFSQRLITWWEHRQVSPDVRPSHISSPGISKYGHQVGLTNVGDRGRVLVRMLSMPRPPLTTGPLQRLFPLCGACFFWFSPPFLELSSILIYSGKSPLTSPVRSHSYYISSWSHLLGDLFFKIYFGDWIVWFFVCLYFGTSKV